MLDLDSLAEQRARHLKQQAEDWRDAIWSPEFQTFSANLSDGEVEQLIASCTSVNHLRKVVAVLNERSASAQVPPFTWLAEEAARSGMTPEQWIQSQASNQ